MSQKLKYQDGREFPPRFQCHFSCLARSVCVAVMKNKKRNVIRVLINASFIILSVFSPLVVSAADQTELKKGHPPQSLTSKATTSRENNKYDQLINIVESIQLTRQDLDELKASLARTKDDLEIKQLNQDKTKLSESIKQLRRSLESVATGAAEIEIFDERPAQKFDWQADLLEIFRPVIFELKQMTERPRVIEKLRNNKVSLTARLSVATNAVDEISVISEEIKSPELVKELAKLEKKWRKRRDKIENRLELVLFQLEEKLNPPEESKLNIITEMRHFFSGRGLSIVLALSAFFIVYFLLKLLVRGVLWLLPRAKDKEARVFSRITFLGFKALIILSAILAAMSVLYVRGDWLILTILIIFFVGVGWALRQSVPRYIQETKILLNVGSVREGERVFYQGLPWRVAELNLRCTLSNPALMGGNIRLPLDTIVDLESRKYARDEPWFPCGLGDYVKLDDDLLGYITVQTPELVQMNVLGGSIKTYSTEAFLALNPRNLSHGFGVFITFGVDYVHQAIAISEIADQLQTDLQQAIFDQPFGKWNQKLNVEFKEASASSLDFLIISLFDGAAASDYFSINRFFHREAVVSCNKQGWRIPFNQLTVHVEQDRPD